VSTQMTRPNYLFIGLLFISFAFHYVIFIQIVDIYRSSNTTYIELTVQNESKPVVRSIPRPRIKQSQPKIYNSSIQNIQPRSIPNLSIDPVNPIQHDPLSETIDTPKMPTVPNYSGFHAETWNPQGIFGDFISRNDYHEMLRNRIESNKKYPSIAKRRHLEGRVKVRLSIDANGMIETVTIAKSSGYKILDNAAVESVKNSSPFPPPPENLFRVPLLIELTIVFELT